MSGIAGILHLDGAPVDPALLERLAGAIRFRGPQRTAIWTDGPIGFAHSLLATSTESASEQQPISLDGRSWILADARIDARDDLRRALAGHNLEPPLTCSDAELILRSYLAWGESCLDHLLGDFSFVIWDSHRRWLFCAHDHLGVRPFFYSQLPGVFLFSNTLSALFSHPELPHDLNDSAVADFLLCGHNQDSSATTFASIRRLPPAHFLTIRDGKPSIRRYWSISPSEPLRLLRREDYLDQFREHLCTAVSDRIRSDSAGIFFSGGLDSTTVTVAASDVLSRSGRSPNLKAFTVVYDRLIPDQERHFAGLAARALSLPIDFLPGDDCRPFEGWDDPAVLPPEPFDDPFRAASLAQFRHAALSPRTVLTGLGGDILLTSPETYFVDLLKNREFSRFLSEVTGFLWTYRRRPPLLLRTWLRQRLRRPPNPPPLPKWLNPGLVSSLDLHGRWRSLHAPPSSSPDARTLALRSLHSPMAQLYFEINDPGFTRAPLEVAHPLLDLRMVRFLSSLPPLPWCANKELFRSLLRGRLPEEVRLRPKAPLAGDPLFESLRLPDAHSWFRLTPSPSLSRFVDWSRLPSLSDLSTSSLAWTHVRPVALGYWLASRSRSTHDSPAHAVIAGHT